MFGVIDGMDSLGCSREIGGLVFMGVGDQVFKPKDSNMHATTNSCPWRLHYAFRT